LPANDPVEDVLTQPAAAVSVAGNTAGSIVVGDHNFVVNTSYGTIINQQAAPRVQRRGTSTGSQLCSMTHRQLWS
jgi:hypothetical protein